MEKLALVVGANGIAGRSIAELLAERGDWGVISLSRKPSALGVIGTHICVDLCSKEECLAHAPALREATHVFYAARSGQPNLEAETRVNSQMLENLMDAIGSDSTRLQHVNLVHGTKWYGSTHYSGYSGYKTPAREDDPRHQPFNFYHLQQDLLEQRRTDQAWTWSSVRPHTIWGVTVGYAHNFPLLLAVFAVISKHLNMPLRFPGSEACYDSISQATDAGLLARAMLWSATTPGCANQAFNMVNSDFFRWRFLWPELAEFFDMEAGPVNSMRLADFMADKEPVWNEIVARHGLRPTPFHDLGSWTFADGVMRSGNDDMSSTAKCRRFGFHDVVETDEMCFSLFSELRRRRIIP